MKDQKKGFVNLGISALKEADDEQTREQGYKEGEKKRPLTVKAQWIAPNGVPTVLLKAYEAIKILNLPVSPVLLSMMAINVFIPSKFVIAAHGALAEKQNKTENFRPSVDGLLENYLSDLVWEPMPLVRKVGQANLNTGKVKLGVTITNGLNVRSTLPDDIVQAVKVDKAFRRKYRSDAVLPTAIRIRVYITRAIGVVPVQRITTINPYLSFTFGNKKVSGMW